MILHEIRPKLKLHLDEKKKEVVKRWNIVKRALMCLFSSSRLKYLSFFSIPASICTWDGLSRPNNILPTVWGHVYGLYKQLVLLFLKPRKYEHVVHVYN